MLQTILSNIAFFKTINPNIASILQNTFEGKNKQYQLYCDNEINILDVEKKRFLYPKNAFLSISQKLSFQPLNNPLWHIYSNNIHLQKTQNLGATSHAINQIFSLAEKSTDDKTLYHLPPLFLPQTNIFGLYGGLFLALLLEDGYRFHSLLLYEENPELFAISCYFVDYALLFERVSPKSCYIFIESLVNKTFLNHYFYSKKVTNNFLRLELDIFKSKKTQAIKHITYETYKANARGWGSFEDEMIGLKNTLKNIKKASFLDLTHKLNVPICVVGSGPSLEMCIDFLKENASKMLIFSCGTALKILKANGIEVDMQIEIERVPYLDEVLVESSLDSTPLLCASLVDTKVISLAKQAYLFLRGGSASAYILDDLKIIEFCAPFVGNAGFSLACQLSDEIILCGMDCGYIQGKSKHSSGSYYGSEGIEIPKDCFEVQGNSHLKVFSNAIFSLSKETLSLAISHYKPKNVYNIGFGAYIKGAKSATNPAKSAINNAESTSCLRLPFVIDKKNILSQLRTTNNKKIKENSLNDALDFINNIKKIFERNIDSKQELFCFIDEVSEFLAKTSFKLPHIGILFEGSLSHILQNVLIYILCVKQNDISSYFEMCRDVVFEMLDEFSKEISLIFKS